jgi:hypothetical protein
MKSSRTMQCVRAGLTVALGLTLVFGSGSVRAQQDQPNRSQYAGMEHIGGEVASVDGMNLTVKTENEKMVQIVTTTNTRVMRGRGLAVKIGDLKVGDGRTWARRISRAR